MKLFLLLLLRRGCVTARTSAIEWMWPDPDYEPERAYTVVAMCVTELRKAGVPIKVSYGRGIEIGI
jgi:two-component SAPR family response regulator